MARKSPSGGARRLSDEVESLAREVARDSFSAARRTWRLAGRVGRRGLEWAEETAERLLKELE